MLDSFTLRERVEKDMTCHNMSASEALNEPLESVGFKPCIGSKGQVDMMLVCARMIIDQSGENDAC